jgi:dephospho-CoA kinase
MRYLITSRSGAGKSTVCRELQRRGLPAFDGDDVPGLAGWADAVSGRPVTLDYGQQIIDRDRFHWNWKPAVLHQLLDSHPQLFLCGSADNQLEFHGLFDRVFVLTLPPDIQRRRLIVRTSHDYGKHPAMQDRIITEQRIFAAATVAAGAQAINANRPVTRIVDDIVQVLTDER